MNQRLKKIFHSIFARRKKIIPITILCLVTVMTFTTFFIPATAHASLASFLGLDSFSQLINTALATVAYFVMTICAWILGLVGLAFDAVLNFTVVNMKTNLAGIKIINNGWADIRDIGNLIFIFMAIYLGIQEIIGLNAGKIKILVRNLIIVGLLVNFSLFFTQLLIDASNILTISFYNLVLHVISNTNDSFTTVFAQRLGLSTLYKPVPPNLASKTITGLATMGFGQIIVVGVGSSLFFLITAVTFLFAGVLFIIRFVIFIFLMVLSPIAFLFSVLPGKLQSISKTWWETLSGQLIFAPLYMILILLVALTINSGGINVSNLSGALTSEATSQDVTTQAAISAGQNPLVGVTQIGTCNSADSSNCSIIYQIFFFVLIIILMNAAMVLSMNWAMKGSSISSKAVGWVGDKARGTMRTVYGAPVRIAGSAGAGGGQKTFGRLSRWISNDGSDGTKASRTGAALARGTSGNHNVVTRTTAKLIRGGLGGIANSSFDIRNIPGVHNLSKSMGINTGKGKEGGYQAHLEREANESLKNVLETGGPTRETAQELNESRAHLSQQRQGYANILAEEKPILEREAREKKTQGPVSASVIRDKEMIANKKAAAIGAIQKAEKRVKTAERTRNNEIKSQQAALIQSQLKHSGINNFITGRRKAVYAMVAEKFSAQSKSAGKDKKAQEEERISNLNDQLRIAMATNDSNKISSAFGDIRPTDIPKLSPDIITNNWIHLDDNQRKSVKTRLSPNDRRKVEEIEQRTPPGPTTNPNA